MSQTTPAPETAVRETLPDPDAGTVGDAGCVDYPASFFEQVRDEPGGLNYRFCFRDGMLSDKQIIREPTS